MKTLESVKNDVFASFADAQMSKEEMKKIIGGARWKCSYFRSGSNELHTETTFHNSATAIENCSGNVQNGIYCGGCEEITAESELKS